MKYTSRTMIDETISAIHEHRPSAIEPLQDLVSWFDATIWTPRLADIVEHDDSRGMAGKVGTVELLTYCTAGRTMLTFRHDDGHWVSAVAATDERPGRMGLQGIEATIAQAMALVTTIAEASESGRLEMLPNSEVSVV